MGLNVLFFQHPGTCSRDIFADIIDGYREAGHNVFVIELAPIWDNLDTFPTPGLKKELAGRVSEQVLAVAATHKIDLCVCMWGNGPATLADDGTQNFFDVNKLPILMHWLDAPQWAHQSQVLDVPRWAFNGPYNYHYINNSTTAREMAGVLGFSNIITLSNAASPTTFSPQPTGEKDFDIIFGVAEDTVKPTPLMLQELEKDEPNVQAIRADMAASLRDQLINVVRPNSKHPTHAERFVDQVLNARLEHRHAAILEQVGELPYHEQSSAYGRSWFALNVMRWQDDSGLNLKPFEITLSGTCLLQAHRVGVEDHFDSAEAVVLNAPHECRKRVAGMLSDPDRITQMAEQGHSGNTAGVTAQPPLAA